MVAAAGLYLYSERAGRDDAPGPPALPEPRRPAEESARYPLPDPDSPSQVPRVESRDDGGDFTAPLIRPPLPALEDSDEAIRAALAGVVSPDALERWLRPRRIIERTVVVVSNLDAAPVPVRFRPVKPIPDLPVVRESGDEIVLDPANAERYRSLVRLLESVEPEALAGVYTRFYPLFQQAYDELGHPGGYFNDRVVEVIDHLLATPETDPTPRLKRPEVLYQFADPRLEQLSWGRKVLLRMAPAQAEAVKNWLRDLRREIIAAPPGPGI